MPGLRCVQDPDHGSSNYQSFWLEVGDAYPLDREQLLEYLARAEVSARRGIMASHRQPAYADVDHGPLPVTERLNDRTLILPVFHEMTREQQDRVIDAVRTGRSSEV